jgi:acyl-CoA synthetase (AMP-forming)/AMP-acid ligase II
MIATEDLKRRAQTDVVLFGLGPEDVLLNILPISFDVGLNQILAALLAGCETVICQSFLPADILTIAKERHVTGIPSVPSIWQDFLNTGLRFDCIGEHSHLRFVTISGGDMCPTGLGRMREIVGDARIYKTYGQTEAFRTTTLLPDEFALKRTSVGQPYPGVTVAIMRPDGSLASRNETGELVRKTSPSPQLAGVTVSSARLRLLGCRGQRDRAWVGDGGQGGSLQVRGGIFAA